jgi:hypothetical protein
MYLFKKDRGAAAHWKLIEQLAILSSRIHDQMPRFLEAMSDHTDTSRRCFREAAVLRLDLECYIEVLTRFFRLCRDVTGLDAIWREPLVRRVRHIRNRIVEHGYELDREGGRGFYCDENGPKLISETGETECPSFIELEEQVAQLLKQYGLTRTEFQIRFTAIRGPHVSE